VERDLRIIIFAKRRISRGEEVSIMVTVKSWFLHLGVLHSYNFCMVFLQFSLLLKSTFYGLTLNFGFTNYCFGFGSYTPAVWI
jgi:hypothetical protein